MSLEYSKLSTEPNCWVGMDEWEVLCCFVELVFETIFWCSWCFLRAFYYNLQVLLLTLGVTKELAFVVPELLDPTSSCNFILPALKSSVRPGMRSSPYIGQLTAKSWLWVFTLRYWVRDLFPYFIATWVKIWKWRYMIVWKLLFKTNCLLIIRAPI